MSAVGDSKACIAGSETQQNTLQHVYLTNLLIGFRNKQLCLDIILYMAYSILTNNPLRGHCQVVQCSSERDTSATTSWLLLHRSGLELFLDHSLPLLVVSVPYDIVQVAL